MILCSVSVQIVEFIRLAGGDAKICEYNQEACRLDAFDGKKSLVRSFPSKVGVRRRDSNSGGEGAQTTPRQSARRRAKRNRASLGLAHLPERGKRRA